MTAEILTKAESREAERLAAEAGISSLTLMERAGLATAKATIARLSSRRGGDGLRILVLCGPGGNGGDGFAAARLLAQRGCRVSTASLRRREDYSGDAGTMARRWDGEAATLDEATFRTRLQEADGVVDALFGIGLNRDLDDETAALIATLNAAQLPVIAVDAASGLDADSGRLRGATAVRAAATVAFFRPKPCHYLLPGRLYSGDVTVADIGIPDDVPARIKPRRFLNLLDRPHRLPPRPRLSDHKYKRGSVIAVGGEAEMSGACRLAAYGALRIGAGHVTLAVPRETMAIHAAASSAFVLAERNDLLSLSAARNHAAIAIGPGAGKGAATRRQILRLMGAGGGGHGGGIALDADALTCFADDPSLLFAAIAARRARGAAPPVLTPHEGEFRRLFPDIDASGKFERVAAAARRSGAVTLCKGADTVIASPDADGAMVVNANAPPDLASAGSGDVLCGMIAGLLAGGMDPFDAAASAVWIHAEAASAFGAGLIAEDLPDLIPPILQRLRRNDEERGDDED